jgi:hypothetical protein
VVLSEENRPGGFEQSGDWTLHRLHRLWECMTSQLDGGVRICLFIDGLDEYHGGKMGDMEIAEFVQRLKHSDVKICLSSRAHRAFEHVFGQGPQLRLQDLTAPDMRLYIRKRFNGIPDPEKERIAKKIVQKAAGVFLWVTLVVTSLLEGLINGDKDRDLEARLNEVPDDLESLFWHVLSRFDEANGRNYRQQAFWHLSLVRYARSKGWSPTLLRLYFSELSSDDNDGKDPVYLPLRDVSELFNPSRLLAECNRLSRRLTSRCRGLLEATRHDSDSPARRRINFLHTSVAAFLDNLRIRTDPDWPTESEVRRALMRSTLLEMKYLANRGIDLDREGWFTTFRPLICRFLSLAGDEEQIGEAPTELVDELEWTADEVWSQVLGRTKDEIEGETYWAAALEEPFETRFVRRESLSWDEGFEDIYPRYHSFVEFAEGAGLELYVAAKLREAAQETMSQGSSEREEGGEVIKSDSDVWETESDSDSAGEVLSD